VTFVLGSEDPHLDPAAAAQQADHLESLGCRASVVTFAGGHHLDPATLQALVK
jgi:predicted esterase